MKFGEWSPLCLEVRHGWTPRGTKVERWDVVMRHEDGREIEIFVAGTDGTNMVEAARKAVQRGLGWHG